MKTNYYELVHAKIHNEKLVYSNLLFLTKETKIKEIAGYKNGVDDNSCEYVSIISNENKKIATLKINTYSNVPEFLEALNCECIGFEHTTFQKIIQKIKFYLK